MHGIFIKLHRFFIRKNRYASVLGLRKFVEIHTQLRHCLKILSTLVYKNRLGMSIKDCFYLNFRKMKKVIENKNQTSILSRHSTISLTFFSAPKVSPFCSREWLQPSKIPPVLSGKFLAAACILDSGMYGSAVPAKKSPLISER